MATRLISKNSLYNMCDDSSNDSASPYEEDYKIIIRKRELVRIPFLHQSPELMYRKHIINYLKNYASDKRLTYPCLHLAVYLLDIFMDNHAILPERLHLVGNVCLLLSAKFEEVSVNIPKVEELNAAVNNCYSLNEYKVVEIIILKFFHWYLILPTAAHYTHYFMQAVLHAEDNCKRATIFQMQEHVETYLEKVLEDIHFMQLYAPSRLAAAIISAARKQVGLSDWTSKLARFTEYSKDQIYEPVQALLQSTGIVCSNCKDSTD